MALTVELPDELQERYAALARKTGKSQSYYVVKALEQSIDELEETYLVLAELEGWRAGQVMSIPSDEARRACGLFRAGKFVG